MGRYEENAQVELLEGSLEEKTKELALWEIFEYGLEHSGLVFLVFSSLDLDIFNSGVLHDSL